MKFLELLVEIFVGAMVGVCLACFWFLFFACDVYEPPLAPDMPVAVVASSAGVLEVSEPGEGGSLPDVPAPADEELFTGPITRTGDLTVSAVLTNNSVSPAWMGLACYGDPRGDIAHQTLDRPNGEVIVDVRPGQSATVSVECQCGVDLQADTFHGYLEAPVPPYFDAHRHIAVRRLEGAQCLTTFTPKHPPAPPEPPVCPDGQVWNPPSDVWPNGKCCPIVEGSPYPWWGCTA